MLYQKLKDCQIENKELVDQSILTEENQENSM